MILVPGGRKCYCGKSGCADAYCAASVLTQDNRQSLDAFMEKIESGDEKTFQTWNEYLDYLAVLIYLCKCRRRGIHDGSCVWRTQYDRRKRQYPGRGKAI